MPSDESADIGIDLLRIIVEELPFAVFVSEQGKVIYANQVFETDFGWPLEQLIGVHFRRMVSPKSLPLLADRYRRRMAGETLTPDFDYNLLLPDGVSELPVRASTRAAQLDGRNVIIGTLRRVFDPHEKELSLVREMRRVAAQRDALLRLKAPAIEVAQGVIVVPLIGSFNRERCDQLREDTIQAIVVRRAQTLILDLTGLEFEPAICHGLTTIAQTARLLGASTSLVGMSPELAKNLVNLELSLEAFRVFPSLADALRKQLADSG